MGNNKRDIVNEEWIRGLKSNPEKFFESPPLRITLIQNY